MAGVLAVLGGCADEGAGPAVTDELAESDMPPASLFGTTWFVQEIGGDDVIDGAGSMLVLRTAGHVAGSGGCNSFSGPVTIDGDAIAFGALARTEMVCGSALMNQEQKFFAALAASRSYRTRGPYLRFYDGAGTLLVTLIAKVRMP